MNESEAMGGDYLKRCVTRCRFLKTWVPVGCLMWVVADFDIDGAAKVMSYELWPMVVLM